MIEVFVVNKKEKFYYKKFKWFFVFLEKYEYLGGEFFLWFEKE